MKKNLLSLLFSLLAALLFSLVFFRFNTPLGPSIGSDNAMYLTMGTALARGYAPYTQIFDHKGPLLFLLQWIPQALSGGYSTLAVFLQEVLALFLVLRLLAAIARETHASEFLTELLYLTLSAPLAGGGNLSEEYTAVFVLLGIFLCLRCFSRQATPPLFLPALLLGLCSAAAFLTRANNVLPLCGLVLPLALGLLLSRRWAQMGACAGGFLSGLLLLSVPILLWLMSSGSLSSALYGSIIHNMMYAGTDEGSRLSMLLFSDYGHMALLMAALSSCGAVVLMLRRRYALSAGFLLSALLGGYAAFISHKFYQHYLLIGLPTAAAGAALILGAIRPLRLFRHGAAVLVALCFVLLIQEGIHTNRERLAERADLAAFTEDANALYSLVPQNERDRFMAYRVEPRWYAVTKALPCMRFYFLQEILAEANPAIMDEIVHTLETDPPLWMVIYYNRPFNPPYDPRVADLFAHQYTFIASSGDYQLLHLTSGGNP